MEAGDFEDVLSLFFSKDHFDKWVNFINSNCDVFVQKEGDREDFSLAQYEVYEQFNVFVDDQLLCACDSLGYKTADFLEYCKDHSDGADPMVDVFSTLVLSSTEFRLFADVMSDENKRNYFVHIIESWRTTLRSHRK